MPPRLWWRMFGGFMSEMTCIPLSAVKKYPPARYVKGPWAWSLAHFPAEADAWKADEVGPWNDLDTLPPEWGLSPEPASSEQVRVSA